MSVEPFNRLVKLAARAFYDDVTMTKADNQPKAGRSDNRGVAVVVLDALTRRQWVREEDLAKDLKLHSKQLRRTLRFFEEEKLIMRDHRKETAKGVKMYNAAVADGQQDGREGKEKIKIHTHSYCCLDYAHICDVVRYRLYRMRKKLKDGLDNKNVVVGYICPECGKRYNALDVLGLEDENDENNFHCEGCHGLLVVDSGKLAAQETGDGDNSERRQRHEKLEDLLKKMEIQLKPLTEQLNRVKDLAAPEFGTLQGWEARASAAAAAGAASSKSSDGFGFGERTCMPFLGETKVEVAFSGIDDEGEKSTKSESSAMKVLPPWMIKQGMNLTKEQRGEVVLKEEAAASAKMMMDDSKASASASDDKNKSSTDQEDDHKNEYIKAYYAAFSQRQEALAAKRKQEELANSSIVTERQVGMKSKQENDVDEDDVEWEEAPSAGNTSKTATEDDGIDWEEG